MLSPALLLWATRAPPDAGEAMPRPWSFMPTPPYMTEFESPTLIPKLVPCRITDCLSPSSAIDSLLGAMLTHRVKNTLTLRVWRNRQTQRT